MSKKLSISLIAVALVVGLVVGYLVKPGKSLLGGGVSYNALHQVGDLYQGLSDTKVFSEGVLLAPVNSTTGSFSSTLGVSGTLSALGSLNFGGLYSTSSLAASTTLLASTVCDYGIISVVPGNVAGQIGVALPATTTLVADCLPNVGDSKSFLFENAATAATSTVITAPAGITLVSDDANGDIIAQNGWAEITITKIRTTGDEFSAVIRPFIDAD